MVVRGYEYGYNDISNLRMVKIKLNENAPWYLGGYKDSEDIKAMDGVNLYGEHKNPKEEWFDPPSPAEESNGNFL